MKDYGEYAIGLTKRWGINRDVCPVLYAHEMSGPIRALNQLVDHSLSHLVSDLPTLFFELLPYIKPYEGPYWHRGRRRTIRFYDEREWRYIPDSWKELSVLDKADYLDPDKRADANHELYARHPPLGFEPSDIKYIIVSREDELQEMIAELHRIKSPKYNESERNLLVTRLSSAEQIRRDY